MASKITIVVESDADANIGLVANGGGITVTRNMNDNGLGRILDAYKFVYEVADAFDGKSVTRRRVIRKWFTDYVKATKDVAKRVEVDKAVKNARDSVSDIEDNDA